MNEDIMQNINQRLDEAVERGRQMIEDEDLPEQLDELKMRAEELIRQHPLKSIATGFVIGYIIGKVIRSED